MIQMQIAHIPVNAKLYTNPQDVEAVMIELDFPQDERADYDSIFITDEGKVWGFSGIVPYLDKPVYYLGAI